MADKFDECRYCQFRGTDVCEDCDSGELFEHIDDEGLDFDKLDLDGDEAEFAEESKLKSKAA